jgi:hypothetical protein
MNMCRWILISASWGLFAAGCGIEKHNPWRSGDTGGGKSGQWSLTQESPRNIQPEVDQAADCSTVDTYLKTRMSLEMEASIRAQLKGAFASAAVGSGRAIPVSARPDAAPQAKAGGESAPSSFTDTNNQVDGIEEPDALKTDGTFFYHLDGTKLRISKAWPVTEMQALATLELPGYPQQMLLTEDKKLVIFLLQLATDPTGGTGPATADVAVLNAKRAPGFLPSHDSAIDVVTIDVSNPSTPVVADRRTLAGSVVGVRRVGDQVRIVMSRYIPLPTDVNPYLGSEIYQMSNADKIAAAETLIRRNKLLIHNQPVANLISSTTPGLALSSDDCRTMFLPRVSTSLGATDIHTINLSTGTDHVATLLSRSDGLHGARDAIYLSTQHYWWNQDSFDTNYLYVHKFSYNDAGEPEFRGSAGMEGNILNQFAMDEFEGHLRVAATINQRANPDTFEQTVYNRVYVVKDYDGFLAVAGMTEPMAPGETIFGVRFAGPLGFVVTFRRVDPLFVIGFQEPIKPVVLGELKIPGYSTYLHPLADGLLLAVGEEIDENSQMALGNKISLFDVSNPAQPVERFKKVLSPDIYTESIYNHKSFKYHPASKTLALPSWAATTCPPTAICEYAYGISLYRIDPDAGIEDRGFLNLASRISTLPADGDDDIVANSGQMHAVIADDVVYGIDGLGVKGAMLAAPGGHSWELSYR